MSSEPIQVKHYNMGQASGHAIITDEAAVVVDAGVKRGKNSNAQTVEEDVQGADPLILIATHLHQDHTSGLEHLCENLDVDQVYVPRGVPATTSAAVSLFQKPVPVQHVTRGTPPLNPSNRVTIDFLLPPPDIGAPAKLQTEDDGIVARARIAPEPGDAGDEVSLLFLGDLSRYFQKQLKRHHDDALRNADGITLPHHGSKNNVVAEFRELGADTLHKIGVERAWEDKSPFRKYLNDSIEPAHLSADDIGRVRAPVLKQICPDNIVISADPEHSHGLPNVATILAVSSINQQPKVWATFRNGDITWHIEADGSFTITPEDGRTNGNLDRLISSWLD